MVTTEPQTEPQKPKAAFHSGDLGDILYSLPTLKHLGGQWDLYLDTRPWTKEMTQARFDAIAGLLRVQPYLNQVILGTPDKIDVDFSTFRNGGMPFGQNIVDIQSNWVAHQDIPYQPWLEAEPDPQSKGRVIVHRSPRYRNNSFDWRSMIKHLGSRALSVGFPDEHKALEDITGFSIERVELRDYQHLAELIQGADFFVGNQSSPMGVAIGLGKPSIQETCLWIPDCIYKGAPIKYVINGVVTVEGQTLVSPSAVTLGTNYTPPKGWIYVDKDGKTYQNMIIGNMARALKVSEKEILAQNTKRVLRDYPSFLGVDYNSPSRLILHLQKLGIDSFAGDF